MLLKQYNYFHWLTFFAGDINNIDQEKIADILSLLPGMEGESKGTCTSQTKSTIKTDSTSLLRIISHT